MIDYDRGASEYAQHRRAETGLVDVLRELLRPAAQLCAANASQTHLQPKSPPGVLKPCYHYR